MVDENISISNLIYFMKTMLSEVFKAGCETYGCVRAFSRLWSRASNWISTVLICGGRGLPDLQALRLAGAVSLRDDPSERA